MSLKLYKAAEVCDMAQLQPYVLRSWEKEFPGIGVQKAADGPRLYRQTDVEQVLRIKQLVFGEGLTLAGARRRIEESAPPVVVEAEAPGVPEAISSEARDRIGKVRDGLRSLLTMLSAQPGSTLFAAAPAGAPAPRALEDYQLEPPAAEARKVRSLPARRSTEPVDAAAPVKRKRAHA